MTRHATRKLLGRIELTDRFIEDIDRSGLLDIVFSPERPDSTLTSLDGRRAVASLLPSGAVGALLVQGYVNGERRTIPFAFGVIEVVSEGHELSIFLQPGPAREP